MSPYAVALLLVLGIGLDRCAPVIGAQAQLARVSAERDAAQRQAIQAGDLAKAWRGRFDEAEAIRRKEAQAARAALAEAGGACEARVAKARKSAAAIAAIVTKEPARDPQGCPVAELVGHDELRDALTPAR